MYVVFPAASGAVEAGLGIVAGAAERVHQGAPDRGRGRGPRRRDRGHDRGPGRGGGQHLRQGVRQGPGRRGPRHRHGESPDPNVPALSLHVSGHPEPQGIAGGIPLYRVEAVPAQGRARLRRQLGARRGRLVVLAGLAAVLAVGAVGAWAANRPADCLTLPATTKTSSPGSTRPATAWWRCTRWPAAERLGPPRMPSVAPGDDHRPRLRPDYRPAPTRARAPRLRSLPDRECLRAHPSASSCGLTRDTKVIQTIVRRS